MRRGGWWLLGGFAALAPLVLLAARSTTYDVIGEVRPWGAAPTWTPVTPTPTSSGTLGAGTPTLAPRPLPPALTDLAQVALRLAIAAAALGLLVVLVRWWRRQRLVAVPRTEASTAPAEPTPAEVRAAVDAQAEAHLRLIADGEPRQAILACWQAIEAAVARSGGGDLARRWRTLTPTELAATAQRAYDLPVPPLVELSALYREARFSTHAVGEAHRARAVEALQQLRAALAGVP